MDVKELKSDCLGTLFEVRVRLCAAGAVDFALCQSESKVWVCSRPKAIAGSGLLKRMRQDSYRVAGAIQKTYPADMFRGQGADFVRRVAFWIIRS